MSRFQLLEKEINKNLNIDSKSNELISGWSPNNVRRLVIGAEHAVVQYFATGGKYNRRLEVVSLESELRKELEELQQGKATPTSLLLVLTKGRICSSVEEIVFCTKRYPHELLKSDSDLHTLSKTGTTLTTRFPRLRYVYLADMEAKDIAPHMKDSIGGTELLFDALKETNVGIKLISRTNESTWYKGTALRPKYYSMDDTILKGYFEKVEEKYEKQLRDSKLAQIDKNKDDDLKRDVAGLTFQLSKTISFYREITSIAGSIFKKSTILEKAEWAKYLESKNMVSLLSVQFKANKKLTSTLSKLSISSLDGVKSLAGDGSTEASLVYDILDIYTKELGVGAIETAQATLSVKETVESLGYLAHELLLAQYSVIALALASYLSRNTLKYVKYNKDQLSIVDWHISFSTRVATFCDVHLTGVLFAKVCQEANFDLSSNGKNTISRSRDILNALGGVGSV